MDFKNEISSSENEFNFELLRNEIDIHERINNKETNKLKEMEIAI